ncbi:hypothetical protein RCL1_000598 [Eukaryota sp. TZLM3-RCL]
MQTKTCGVCLSWSTRFLLWSLIPFLGALLFQFVVTPNSNIFYPSDLSISYPLTTETVPTWALFPPLVILLVVVLPLSFPHNFIRNSLLATCSTVFAFSINFFFTGFFKVLVGRLRPDFLARCVLVDGECMGDAAVIREGRLSFFSGHAAFSFHFAMFFISIVHFSATSRQRNKSRPVAPPVLLACAGFFSLASFVAISRVVDYRHHPSDVVVGSFVGIITGLYGYFLFSRHESDVDCQCRDLPHYKTHLMVPKSTSPSPNNQGTSNELGLTSRVAQMV